MGQLRQGTNLYLQTRLSCQRDPQAAEQWYLQQLNDNKKIRSQTSTRYFHYPRCQSALPTVVIDGAIRHDAQMVTQAVFESEVVFVGCDGKTALRPQVTGAVATARPQHGTTHGPQPPAHGPQPQSQPQPLSQ